MLEYITLYYSCIGGAQASSISLCPGEQLNLTCQATPGVTLIQWDLNFPDISDPEIRFISSGGSTENSASIFSLSQTVFHFSRTSTSPLASLIIINNATTSLSGTRVDCSYDGSVMSASNINVIGNGMIINILRVQYSVVCYRYYNIMSHNCETIFLVVHNPSFKKLPLINFCAFIRTTLLMVHIILIMHASIKLMS